MRGGTALRLRRSGAPVTACWVGTRLRARPPPTHGGSANAPGNAARLLETGGEGVRGGGGIRVEGQLGKELEGTDCEGATIEGALAGGGDGMGR